MITLKSLINSTACAIAVLDGTDGGYSPNEKQLCKETLIHLQVELTKAMRESGRDPATLSVKQELFIGAQESLPGIVTGEGDRL